jgi:hypothetical protein
MPDCGKPAIPMAGGCPCGAVRYEIGAFPLLLYACHCTDCQRECGSAFALNMPVATGSFRILQGVPRAWRRVKPSGVRTASWFCGDCSGRLYGERDSRPASVNVRAGTLDDRSWLVPVAHIFMRSALSWDKVTGGAECFETRPEDWRPLTARWRETWNVSARP